MNSTDSTNPKDCCQPKATQGLGRHKLLWVVGLLVFMLGLSKFLPVLQPFATVFVFYVKTIWWAILLGLVLGGVIEHFVPSVYISQILARKKKRTIVYAVGLGFLSSACCHGILALAIELYKKGASVPAVVAFLLASPWANLPLTVVLIGFFGVGQALFIVFVAVVVALVTGFIFQFLDRHNWIEKNTNTLAFDETYSISSDFKKRFSQYRFSVLQLKKDFKGIAQWVKSLTNMVLWWVVIGIALASLIGAYVPEHIFHRYMGPSVLGLIVTLGAAFILEVCSEGTAPLAFEIYRQTGALGNSLVFLMAGVATDYTEIGLLWTNIGRKTALWLPAIAVPQIIFWGVLANKLF